MDWRQSLQISLELWGALFCFFCALGVWIGHNAKSDTVIVYMQVMVGILLVMDALAWAFRGYPGYAGYYMVRITNFAVFILNFMIMIEFSKYIAIIIQKELPV